MPAPSNASVAVLVPSPIPAVPNVKNVMQVKQELELTVYAQNVKLVSTVLVL